MERERRELLKCSVKRRNLPLVALGGDINILPPETPTCLPHPLWSPPFPTLNPQPSYLKRFPLNACSNVNLANITDHFSSTTKNKSVVINRQYKGLLSRGCSSDGGKESGHFNNQRSAQHITHTDTHRSTSPLTERFAHMQLKGVAFISFIDY